MDDGVKIYISVYSIVLACLCYCHFISSRIPKGFFRLLSILPVVSIFTILPPYLPSIFFKSVLSWFITWLGNSKLLLFAFGQGPLSSAQSSNSLLVFIVSAALPIRTTSQWPSKTSKKLPILNNLGAEVVACAVLIGLIVKYRVSLDPRILLVAYCFLIFLLVDCLVAISSFVVKAVIGLELEPPSDEPYLSTSLQDFWGRRWNLIVTNTLRLTVYAPVRSGAAAIVGRDLSRVAAVLSTFVVSGLMHELLVYYATGVVPTWEMTAFFVLHGVCVVVEMAVKKALKGRWDLPGIVSVPLTVGFVIWTSFWLFFPPLTRDNIDAVVFEEFRCFAERVRNGMFVLFTNFIGFLN